VNGYISFATARRSQADRLATAIPYLRDQIAALRAEHGLRGRGPVFTGIGASLAAAAGGVWHLRDRGIDSWRLAAGDNPTPLPAGESLVFGISQSGRSTETLAALESVRPDLRAAIVNKADSPIGHVAEVLVDFGDIPDSYASTVGYTATAIAVSFVAEAWDDGAIDDSWSGIPDVITDLRERVADSVARSVGFFAGASGADFAATGPSVGSAEVGALLFREVARVPTAAFGTRQYLHGSMESAGDGVHVLIGSEREAGVADSLSRAGHKVVFVTDIPAEESDLVSVVRLPEVTTTQRPVLEAVVLQDLVEGVALQRGVDIEEFVFYHDDTKVASGESA